MLLKRFIFVLVMGFLLVSCGGGEQSPSLEPTNPSEASLPTDTAEPTRTPEPTSSPKPTSTPRPSPTLPPPPEPIHIEGSGNDIIDIDKPADPMIAVIEGNACSRYFGVWNLDGDNEDIDLLVNTGDSYKGIQPLDWRNDEWTKRIKVEASCAWTIDLLPLTEARVLDVPDTIEGTGSDVFLLTGDTPDLIRISGNAGSNYFGVWSVSDGTDLLANTGDPFEGTDVLDKDTAAIIVEAEGDWTIEVTAK